MNKWDALKRKTYDTGSGRDVHRIDPSHRAFQVWCFSHFSSVRRKFTEVAVAVLVTTRVDVCGFACGNNVACPTGSIGLQ